MNIIVAVTHEDSLRPDIRDIHRCGCAVRDALNRAGHTAALFPVGKEDFPAGAGLKNRLTEAAPDAVFNLFEGFGDDASKEADFAAFLESLRVPFTGNGSRTLRICIDKLHVKTLLAEAGIDVPRGTAVRTAADLEKIRLKPPIFIKPCCEDGNVGIEEDALVLPSAVPAGDRERIRRIAAEKLARFPGGIIVEEFIPGAEYSAGCCGNGPYEILGVSRMDYAGHPELPPFFTYASKWDEDSAAYRALMPDDAAPIPGSILERIADTVVSAGRILGLRSYFRIDLRERNGRLYVLDVNPNPGINTDSGLVRQTSAAGYGYDAFIEKILTESLKPAEEV